MTPRYRLRPIAKRGWSDRLYPVWEFLTFVGGVALLLGIFFFATWTGR